MFLAVPDESLDRRWKQLVFRLNSMAGRCLARCGFGTIPTPVWRIQRVVNDPESTYPEKMSGPLFVCYANCSRSVLACYLYRHLCKQAPARSAGLEPGERISDRAEALLRAWGIDASAHVPCKLTSELCAAADAIFVMAPSYLHRMLWEFGDELASKSYLFADPFSMPLSFDNGEYRVSDPSFDERPIDELLGELAWMRERVLQIRLALLDEVHLDAPLDARSGPRQRRRLIPASQYLELCRTVDRGSH